MAYTTGTATDYKDLLSRLITFVTTDATLVGAGQNWTVHRADTTGDYEYILEGPGLAAADNIFVGIRTYEDADSDYFNWAMRGFIGYDGDLAFDMQPGVSPEKHISLWDTSIPYWIVANGRRIVVIARISSVYQSAYLGFITPYTDPMQYPYPLAIGGTNNSSVRWSSTSDFHRAFFDPAESLTIRYQDGAWRGYSNWSGEFGTPLYNRNIWPYSYGGSQQPREIQNWRNGPGGGYALIPQVFHANDPYTHMLGEFDGIAAVSGFSLASEDIINVGADNYIVFNDVYRTNPSNYAVLKLA